MMMMMMMMMMMLMLLVLLMYVCDSWMQCGYDVTGINTQSVHS